MQSQTSVLSSCAFTGHRPAHFIFRYNERHPACAELKRVLSGQILRLYAAGIRHFYTGCALGVDLWAGEAVLSLREQCPGIELICAVPFRGMEQRWSPEQQRRYRNLLESSSEIFFLSERYSSSCFFVRNRFLVDRADMLLAVFDRQAEGRSGTGYTVRYAQQRGKPIRLIHPETFLVSDCDL